MKNKLFLPILFLISAQAAAPAQEYAREVIERLSSAEFLGRGYVDDGAGRAARYIAAQLADAGARPLAGGSYFQEFRFDINTFPQTPVCRVDGRALEPVAGFTVAARSAAARGAFALMPFDAARVADTAYLDSLRTLDLAATFLVAPGALARDSRLYSAGARGYVLADKSLAWSVNGAHRQEGYTAVHVADTLLGDSPREIELDVEPLLVQGFRNLNVAARVAPREGEADSSIVFAAHYDHLGALGRGHYFPGANDNASGVALLLDLARRFAASPPRGYNVDFLFFAAEEAGILGSRHYVQEPLSPLDRVSLLVNFDMVGTGAEGITIVNALETPRLLSLVDSLNAARGWFPEVKARGAACNSDHCHFARAGVPAVFLFTRGPEHNFYHDQRDLPATLPLSKWAELTDLAAALVELWGR